MTGKSRDTEVHEDYQRQLWLALEDPATPPGADIDVSFLTRFFCLAGLPVKPPKDESDFHRTTADFALSINAPTLALPASDRRFNVGVPWGPKARLLTVWLSTAARDPDRRPDDRWVDIGPIKPWLASIGVKSCGGKAMNRTKEQLVRLAFASFTMQSVRSGHALVSNDRLVDAAVFGEDDLAHYAAGRIQDVHWPLGIKLSRNAYDMFRRNAIAVPTERLAQVSNSAMAIDLLVFLCYRLPLLTQDESDLVTWRQLAAQFGNREPPSKFRENFDATVASALRAYPEANVEPTAEGLVLRHSDPAVLRRAFVSLAGSDKGPPRARRKLRHRTAITRTEETTMDG